MSCRVPRGRNRFAPAGREANRGKPLPAAIGMRHGRRGAWRAEFRPSILIPGADGFHESQHGWSDSLDDHCKSCGIGVNAVRLIQLRLERYTVE